MVMRTADEDNHIILNTVNVHCKFCRNLVVWFFLFVFLNEEELCKLYNHEVENRLLSEATACGHLLKSLH